MEMDRLYGQLIKLGDMMGDGLHNEPGGEWISKEYRQIVHVLFPEIRRDIAKKKREAIDKKITTLTLNAKCPCGGELK